LHHDRRHRQAPSYGDRSNRLLPTSSTSDLTHPAQAAVRAASALRAPPASTIRLTADAVRWPTQPHGEGDPHEAVRWVLDGQTKGGRLCALDRIRLPPVPARRLGSSCRVRTRPGGGHGGARQRRRICPERKFCTTARYDHRRVASTERHLDLGAWRLEADRAAAGAAGVLVDRHGVAQSGIAPPRPQRVHSAARHGALLLGNGVQGSSTVGRAVPLRPTLADQFGSACASVSCGVRVGVCGGSGRA
jgi:hypothetical protein